jgi:ketosteroid isomerase-like protein
MTTEDVVRAYVAAVEAQDMDEVQKWLADDVEIVEHPNTVSKNGRRYGKAEAKAAGERGKALMASEKYDVTSVLVDGDRAVLQITWSGTLGHGGHEHHRGGHVMKAHICCVMEVRNGKIWRQEQYDCFHP